MFFTPPFFLPLLSSSVSKVPTIPPIITLFLHKQGSDSRPFLPIKGIWLWCTHIFRNYFEGYINAEEHVALELVVYTVYKENLQKQPVFIGKKSSFLIWPHFPEARSFLLTTIHLVSWYSFTILNTLRRLLLWWRTFDNEWYSIF